MATYELATSATYELAAVARVPQTVGPPTLLEVDPIDWTGLTLTDELSRPQRLDASCLVGGLTEPVAQRLRKLHELATELWLWRDGKLVFAGPWLGWQIQGETLTLYSLGLLEYLRFMWVTSDLVYAQVDQHTIVKGLVDHWQTLEHGHFGIDTADVAASGVLRNATYRRDELHNVAQRVDEMGRRQSGFDVEVDPSSRKLRLWYPQQGVDRSVGEDAVVFDARNVTNTNVVCSAAPGDVASDGFGTGTSGTDTIYATKANLALRASFGRTGVSATFDSVSEQGTLEGHVQGLLDARSAALMIPGPDVRTTPDADVGAYGVGDTVDYQLHERLAVTGAFRIRRRVVRVAKTGAEQAALELV